MLVGIQLGVIRLCSGGGVCWGIMPYTALKGDKERLHYTEAFSAQLAPELAENSAVKRARAGVIQGWVTIREVAAGLPQRCPLKTPHCRMTAVAKWGQYRWRDGSLQMVSEPTTVHLPRVGRHAGGIGPGASHEG